MNQENAICKRLKKYISFTRNKRTFGYFISESDEKERKNYHIINPLASF